MLVVGSRVRYRVVGQGIFHCERCGGDRGYARRSGRRWLHVLGIPVLPGPRGAGEHLRCLDCGTCYRVELLAVPTVRRMRAALQQATTTSVLAMLQAGGASSAVARRRGIELIRAAGSAGYGEADLTAGLRLADSSAAGARVESSVRPVGQEGDLDDRLRAAVEEFAVQLDVRAREWFLAGLVQVGLADGTLSPAEREVAQTVARYLGMSRARAQDVIWMAEEASA